MIPEAREVRLKPKVRKVLEARCRAPSTPQRDVKRARIVLLAADGRSTRSIAEEVGVQGLEQVAVFPFAETAQLFKLPQCLPVFVRRESSLDSLEEVKGMFPHFEPVNL